MFMFVFGNAMTQNYNLLRAAGEKRTVSLPAEGKAVFFFLPLILLTCQMRSWRLLFKQWQQQRQCYNSPLLVGLDV